MTLKVADAAGAVVRLDPAAARAAPCGAEVEYTLDGLTAGQVYYVSAVAQQSMGGAWGTSQESRPIPVSGHAYAAESLAEQIRRSGLADAYRAAPISLPDMLTAGMPTRGAIAFDANDDGFEVLPIVREILLRCFMQGTCEVGIRV
eukprot:6356450-Pyramimonas_sp.AAC.1